MICPHCKTKFDPGAINGHRADATGILEFLNKRADRNYRPVDANLRLIAARLEEGATVEECRQVIAKKCREWRGTKMEEFLRPETLFGARKFAGYQGELLVRNGQE